jgi:hypothetical protein
MWPTPPPFGADGNQTTAEFKMNEHLKETSA